SRHSIYGMVVAALGEVDYGLWPRILADYKHGGSVNARCLSSQFPNMVGGGEHSLLDLMSNLPKSIEPVLVTPRPGIFTGSAHKRNIRHDTLPMPPLKQVRFSTFSQWRKAIKAFKPDVLHANNSRAAFYAGITAKTLGIPIIFHCRISDTDGFMDKILMRLVDVIICNSEAVAQRFVDFPKPTHVIYNGLPITPFPNLVNPLPSVDKYVFVCRSDYT
ncbi:MAG: glycosyltransferase family 4 protein, partial [Ghiorsea sp.]|nr:glycosyltransferase family 4 protein [Ghiorsea sp.]